MKWLELNKGHDAASMAALFTDDGVVFRPNQEPTTGITAIKDLFTRDSEQNPKVVSIWTTDSVEISTSGSWPLSMERGRIRVEDSTEQKRTMVSLLQFTAR